MSAIDIGSLLLNAGRRAGLANRLELELGNRTFPASYRPPGGPEPELPEVFRSLPDAVLTALPFAAVLGAKPGTVSKEKLFDLLDASLDLAGEMYEACARLALAIVRSNVEVRADWMTDKKKFEAMTKKVEEWRERIPKFAFDRPRILGLDLYRRSEVSILATLHFSLTEVAHRLVKTLADHLDSFVDLEQVGLIRWDCADGCEYHFFRNVVFSEVEAERKSVKEEFREAVEGRGVRRDRTTKTTTERDTATTHRHGRHVHELIAAKNYTLDAATGVKRPPRVDHLIAAVPGWLKPCMRIVTGKQTVSVVIERDLSVERETEREAAETVTSEYVYRPDPALVCGMYVLAGWDEDEEGLPALAYREPRQLKPAA